MDIYNNTFKHPQNLVEHLYAVIDAKIQQIEHELQSKIQSFELQSAQQNLHLSKGVNAEERFKRCIEQCSHKINLLLLLRNNLNDQNATIVRALIKENIYLFHDKDSLAKQLQIKLPGKAPSANDEASSREGTNMNMPSN